MSPQTDEYSYVTKNITLVGLKKNTSKKQKYLLNSLELLFISNNFFDIHITLANIYFFFFFVCICTSTGYIRGPAFSWNTDFI